jgi:pilus assembly protein CpaB
MAVPGDKVDVLLTQSFEDKVTADPGRKIVGDTVLRDVKVIAIDQQMSPQSNVPAVLSAASADSRIPKTVTLELSEQEARVLMVAAKLGSFQLLVRPLNVVGDARPEDERKPPVWASDVSPALNQIAAPPAGAPLPPLPPPRGTGSSLENSVRYPPGH